ncbi:bifunctional folylpolyglutamate synthase/dihydrofolate synthase [Parafilimonas terrae]|uniref:Dihydrofolate synthase/folylpolyglutamate synthase n=1 Tax=Parafilimonas terrae TaxID=1465490 RepID=A0A1I5WM64_9BACT|nr:folylpolyglutamate synthase/dihydrofolate synthase family protein [Parafilimonas terrae]SFQ20875.1 dihydrofolate synthase / folylpolyglutamate synthase [Parafilimonas terrae]
MTYADTLAYLYEQLPMFSRIGTDAYKKDLTNTKQLCAALNNPQKKFKSIHIAGTNGKGSVSHILAAILQTAGYKTGLYTSPHLKDFRERIKVNGIMCTEEFIIDFTEKIKPQFERLEPSFFEITVAMAFEYFAQQNVDVAVIETGLGGRLDSTNIILPELSIITNIGYDHTQILGDTLEKIAYEKAGIIKQNIPAIIGEVVDETRPVFQTAAKEKNAPLIFAQENFYVQDFNYENNHLKAEVVDVRKDEHHTFLLDLPGIYQTKNIVTVLEAVHQLQLKGWQIKLQHIQKALKQVKHLTGLHGRWEKLKENPAVIVDVAHNAAGIKQLLEQLELESYTRLHLIIGFVKDKDIESILSLLPVTANYYFTKAQLPRALNEKMLAGLAAVHGLKGKYFEDVNAALSEAITRADKEDLVLICGSVFLVAEVNL